jgi:hypothetical protein
MAPVLQLGVAMMVIMRRKVGVLAMLIMTTATAWAQEGAGIRAGASGSPDQFFFGGHIETGPVGDHVTFRPNVEVGVGSGLTLLTVNLEFVDHVPIRHQPWSFYFGGGPAAIISSPRGRNGSDVGGGFNVLLGLQARRGLFTELKVGFIDSPEVKVTVGYAFRNR